MDIIIKIHLWTPSLTFTRSTFSVQTCIIMVWQSSDLQPLFVNSCTHVAPGLLFNPSPSPLGFFFFVMFCFNTTSPQLFHSFLSAYQDDFLWGGSRHKHHPCISSVVLSLRILHFTRLQYLAGPPLCSCRYTLPLYSLVFHMPSKALCSVPFLPLPRVLFDTPGMLMGQSETLSLRISLWLIFISPPTPLLSQIYNLCCLQLQMFCSGFYSL